MKMRLLWSGVAGLALLGCAHERHYTRTYYDDRPAVVVQEPNHVIYDDGRTYVRERDYDSDHLDRLPRYRGKHPDALGWNDPDWYHH